MGKYRFKVGDLGIYIAKRGKGGDLRLGTVVKVLFKGRFLRGDTVQVGGCLRYLLQPADYVIASVDNPDIVAGVRDWQLAKHGNPDSAYSRRTSKDQTHEK